MAKSESIFKLKGTIGGLTFVSGGPHRDYVRAPRGTYKPAIINASLKQEGKMVRMGNVPAKIFKDAIDPYRGKILGGPFWSRLVSFFHKQLKVNGAFDFSKMKHFEIHADYPLDSFINAKPTVRVDKKKSTLEVGIIYDRHPKFKKVNGIDGYVLTVIGIFPDLKKKTAQTSSRQSKILKLKGPIAPLVVTLDVPAKAKDYIVCLKLEACIDGMPSNTVTTTSLCVIDSGRVASTIRIS